MKDALASLRMQQNGEGTRERVPSVYSSLSDAIAASSAQRVA